MDEKYMKMAQNVINFQSALNPNDVRWAAEMNYQNDPDKLRFDKRTPQGSKMKDELTPNFQQSRSPNLGMKMAHDPRDMRTDRGLERGHRREDMVPNLDYFTHGGGYPHPGFNLQTRRDSPPDLMAGERAKQMFARANEGYLSGSSRNMPPDLNKITPEQVEALYKSQNMGISVSISPPEMTERLSILPPGNRAGIPNQRPSPQIEVQHLGDFGRTIPFMGMEDKLLRIAESSNLQKAARAEINAQNAGMFSGMVRMPPSSQVQNFQQGLNIHQQNNLRFNSELMHQAAAAGGFPFGIDPRLFDQNRVFPMSAARSERHSPGEAGSQNIPGGGNENKKGLHPMPRPMALGPNFVPQGYHQTVNIGQGTPISDDLSSASPAGSSPRADYGTPSPKPDDHGRMGTKQKAKSRNEGSNQCGQCGKGFSSSSALAKHKLIHSDERRYICQICSKGFKRQDHLNGHMITHRDKKPYECHFSDCDKSYSDMRSLKRHLENHHGVPPVSSSPTAPQTSLNPSHQPTVISSSNLTCSGNVEDRNNNMKGAVPPERPSSAPSSTHEVRMRTRIRSNSCEDIHTGQNEDEAKHDIETVATDEYDDDIFENSGPKQVEIRVPLNDHSESTHILDNPAKQNTLSNTFDPNMVSPRNPVSSINQMQWSSNQYPGSNFPASASWTNAQTRWSNAQIVAAAMAQGQANLPFFMGYRQPMPQYYPQGCFSNLQNDTSIQMEPSNKKSKSDVISSSQAAFAQNALQMFASMAAQRTPIPTADMLLQQQQGAMGCYPGGPANVNKLTNPAAIAVAAAKDGSMFCVPPNMRLYGGAHPGAAQWQDVIKEENFQHERDLENNIGTPTEENYKHSTVENVRNSSEEDHGRIKEKSQSSSKHFNKNSSRDFNEREQPITNQVSDLDEKEQRISNKVSRLGEKNQPISNKVSRLGEKEQPISNKVSDLDEKDQPMPNKVSVLAVNVNASPVKDSTIASPKRKLKPHPGPIIIPASVNNKVTHSVTFTGSTTRPLSPVRIDYASKMPIYTPPPMLSPRSIFFTGTTCGTPRSAVPLTPGRLLLSARRFSSTAEGGKEDEGEPVPFPEPKINVGLQFQAEVKRKVESREKVEKDEHRATLMWAPLKEDRNKWKEADNFLEMSCSTAMFGGASNKEYAAHILHRTRGSIKEAVRLLLSRRHLLRADDPNADYHYTGSTRWTAKERLKFREAYRTKGKNFHLIQKEVCTKSVKQCVEFYYLWKATNPEGFRARTRYVEVESEQEEEEVSTPSMFETPIATGMKDAIFQCDYPECQARFVSRQALNGHIRVHGGSFGKPIEVRKPKPKPHVIITSSLPRDNNLTSQKRKKSPSPAPSSTTGTATLPDGTPIQFACKVCGRVFSKVKSRSAHMKTHVPKKPDEHKNLNPPPLVAHA